MADNVPEGLSFLEYGRHILAEVLGWPAKGNIELMADCLEGIARSKRLSEIHAYKYMVRAIGLAKEQGITIDRLFFMHGSYATIRPIPKPIPVWKTSAEDHKKATESRQGYFASPEYKAFLERMKKEHNL